MQSLFSFFRLCCRRRSVCEGKREFLLFPSFLFLSFSSLLFSALLSSPLLHFSGWLHFHRFHGFAWSGGLRLWGRQEVACSRCSGRRPQRRRVATHAPSRAQRARHTPSAARRRKVRKMQSTDGFSANGVDAVAWHARTGGWLTGSRFVVHVPHSVDARPLTLMLLPCDSARAPPAPLLLLLLPLTCAAWFVRSFWSETQSNVLGIRGGVHGQDLRHQPWSRRLEALPRGPGWRRWQVGLRAASLIQRMLGRT